jgi:hypothetical protein
VDLSIKQCRDARVTLPGPPFFFEPLTKNISLADTARKIAAEGPYKLEDSPKRVRILLNGTFIADTTKARYVWEHPYYPQFAGSRPWDESTLFLTSFSVTTFTKTISRRRS